MYGASKAKEKPTKIRRKDDNIEMLARGEIETSQLHTFHHLHIIYISTIKSNQRLIKVSKTRLILFPPTF